MKKITGVVICIVLALTVFSGCSKTTELPQSVESKGVIVQIANQKIDPLPIKTKIVFSTVGASAHSLPLFIAQEKGWLKSLNIDLEAISFDNGPIQMEAMASNSWDFGSTGQGGVFSGVIKYNAVIIADLLSDDDTMRVYARTDHKIVKSGKGKVSGYPDIYGTADDWRGAEIMVPGGTIAHYVVAKTIEKLGLTMKDVKIINISAANATTALQAGKGEVASLMSNSAFLFYDNNQFTLVSSAKAIGGGNAVAMMMLNPNTIKDQKKMDAIIKCLDVHFAVVDWMKTMPLEEIVKYQVAMAESRGMSANVPMLTRYMQGTSIYNFEKSYMLQTTVSNDGKLTLAERSIIDPLKFFVSLGNYSDKNVEKISSGFFPKEYMERIKKLRE